MEKIKKYKFSILFIILILVIILFCTYYFFIIRQNQQQPLKQNSNTVISYPQNNSTITTSGYNFVNLSGFITSKVTDLYNKSCDRYPISYTPIPIDLDIHMTSDIILNDPTFYVINNMKDYINNSAGIKSEYDLLNKTFIGEIDTSNSPNSDSYESALPYSCIGVSSLPLGYLEKINYADDAYLLLFFGNQEGIAYPTTFDLTAKIISQKGESYGIADFTISYNAVSSKNSLGNCISGTQNGSPYLNTHDKVTDQCIIKSMKNDIEPNSINTIVDNFVNYFGLQ